MSRRHRLLALPPDWTMIRGLRLTTDGLQGAVLEVATSRITLFAGVHVITAEMAGWSTGAIIACLKTCDTPPGVEPSLLYLTAADLAPLLACGALSCVDQLRLLAHVPGWQP